MKDASKFAVHFPDVPFIGDLGYGLGGGGDQVRLFDTNENLVDFVDYDDTTPWPDCADGNGPTLELTSWDTDNELAENWACINDYGSPGRENVYILSNEVVDIQSISLRNNLLLRF